ncbi:hypothetical protein RJ641_030347 [Dillenia turbinata]|uniref:Uncharacterized protein n=1 Tax=Dillenia turbinata TaxID=194707 RepID=A0AAN8ZK38_9MAGN
MAISVSTSSPDINKDSTSLMGSSPLFSPSSDKQFWSTLRNRVDALLENRRNPDHSSETLINNRSSDRAKRLKEDSLLLLRGFDSVAYSLSQLTSNLDNALQGARDLAKPPTFTEIFHANLNRMENEDDSKIESEDDEEEKQEKEEIEQGKRGLKRKLELEEGHESQADDVPKKNELRPDLAKLKKAKNLAISMASKAASLARELKAIKSDMSFMQERCTLLEEENRRLRDGFVKGIRPEEDDLVRLQLEALLAEKSRLANENANLTRENQCLHQLVEYHQITSQDLTESYEQVIQGMCLDFSSPIAEEAGFGDDGKDGDNSYSLRTPRTRTFGITTSLNELYDKEEGLVDDDQLSF